MNSGSERLGVSDQIQQQIPGAENEDPKGTFLPPTPQGPPCHWAWTPGTSPKRRTLPRGGAVRTVPSLGRSRCLERLGQAQERAAFRQLLSWLSLPLAPSFTPASRHQTGPEVRPAFSLPFWRVQSQLPFAVQETGAGLHYHWEVPGKSFG